MNKFQRYFDRINQRKKGICSKVTGARLMFNKNRMHLALQDKSNKSTTYFQKESHPRKGERKNERIKKSIQ